MFQTGKAHKDAFIAWKHIHKDEHEDMYVFVSHVKTFTLQIVFQRGKTHKDICLCYLETYA